jgi:hypothetical protein
MPQPQDSASVQQLLKSHGLQDNLPPVKPAASSSILDQLTGNPFFTAVYIAYSPVQSAVI